MDSSQQKDQTTASNSATAATPDAAPPAAPLVLPWYKRPLFWGIVLFFLILAYLGWVFWLQWQAAQAMAQRRLNEQQALVTEQQARNEGLAAEIARLKDLLTQEPCVVKEALPTLVLTTPQGQRNQPLQLPPATPQGDKQPATTPPKAGATEPAPKTPAQAQANPHSMAAKLEQATVLILIPSDNGIGMGTGFFVTPQVIATNHHVVNNAPAAFVAGKFGPVPLEAKVIARTTAQGQDFALLRLDKPVAVTPLTFAPARVQRTEKISAWGFPGVVTSEDPVFKKLIKGDPTAIPEVVYTEGVVSVVQERKPPLIIHTATVSQGNSGGPLVNERGEVVGMNTYIQMDNESYRQSSLAIVAETLMTYLKQQGIAYSTAGGK